MTLLTRALTGRACPCKRASNGSRGSTMALQCRPQAQPLLVHPQQGNRAAAAGMLLNMPSQKAPANRISAGEAALEQLINLCDSEGLSLLIQNHKCRCCLHDHHLNAKEQVLVCMFDVSHKVSSQPALSDSQWLHKIGPEKLQTQQAHGHCESVLICHTALGCCLMRLPL